MTTKNEPKYKIEDGKVVNRVTGIAIPDDEPIFILRARDNLALGALMHYWSSIGDNEHARAVHLRIGHFKYFKGQHPELMKSPDTTITEDWNQPHP